MIIISVDLSPTQIVTFQKCYTYPDSEFCIRLSPTQINFNKQGLYDLCLTDPEFKKLYKAINSKNRRGVEIDVNSKKISYSKNYEKKRAIDEILFPIHPLSNIEIEQYFKLQNIDGVCRAKDNLPKQLPANSCCVVNLQDSDEGGSHWTIIINKRGEKHNLYFDSFGVLFPPQNVLDSFKNKPLICSQKRVQRDNSILCGYYSIRLANDILKQGMSYATCISQFTKKPSKINEDLALNLY